jgi:Family of unknown function (DUF6090)
MINFFRKTRYSLMGDSKTKYLKYAIGEILLVVIGILIALSINNWNEHRTNRNEELKFLSAIKVDLLATQEELNINIDRQRRVLNNCARLINLMEAYEAKDNREALISKHANQFQYYIQKGALLWWRAEPITGSYDAMVGSGKTALIANTEISRQLAQYNSLSKSDFEDQENAMNLLAKLSEDISPFLNGLWRYNENYFQGDEEVIDLKYDEAKVNRAMLGLLSNKSFQGTLIHKENLERVRYRHQQVLLDKTLELIDLIDIELGNTTGTND